MDSENCPGEVFSVIPKTENIRELWVCQLYFTSKQPDLHNSRAQICSASQYRIVGNSVFLVTDRSYQHVHGVVTSQDSLPLKAAVVIVGEPTLNGEIVEGN
jgi:hypothetical protein